MDKKVWGLDQSLMLCKYMTLSENIFNQYKIRNMLGVMVHISMPVLGRHKKVKLGAGGQPDLWSSRSAIVTLSQEIKETNKK